MPSAKTASSLTGGSLSTQPFSTKAVSSEFDKLAEIHQALRTGNVTENLQMRAIKNTMSKNDILN